MGGIAIRWNAQQRQGNAADGGLNLERYGVGLSSKQIKSCYRIKQSICLTLLY